MKAALVCAYCSRESEVFHHDHVVPRSRGGPDDAMNIVMACDRCNLSKGAMLPSEWLGQRCPESIRIIEEKVNDKLKERFAKRNRRFEPAEQKAIVLVAAFHYKASDEVDYIGDVLSETESTIRVEVLDAVMATGCGMWWPSGEIRDFPKSECRLFTDRMVCLETALKINAAKFSTIRFR